jgi:hypothetical protein
MWSTPEVSILWETATADPDPDLETVARALEIQVREHFAPVWGRDARVRYVPKRTRLDPDSWWLVVSDNEREADAGGFRDGRVPALL